jgi:hypothetical protein
MDNQGLRLERQGGTTGESWGLPPCSPNPISQEAESSKASTQARESTRSGPTTTRSLMPLGLSNAARVWTYHRSTPASAKRMVHRAGPMPPPPPPRPAPLPLPSHRPQTPDQALDGSRQREPRPLGPVPPRLIVGFATVWRRDQMPPAGSGRVVPASTALGLRCGVYARALRSRVPGRQARGHGQNEQRTALSHLSCPWRTAQRRIPITKSA